MAISHIDSKSLHFDEIQYDNSLSYNIYSPIFLVKIFLIVLNYANLPHLRYIDNQQH